MALNQRQCPSETRVERQTEETPGEDRGRDVREEATSPGKPGARRSWKRQEGPSAGASGGRAVLGHLDLRYLVSRTERGQVTVVQSLHVWLFVTTAPGSSAGSGQLPALF